MSQPKAAIGCGREAAVGRLWRFALAFYRQPDVAAALIALQDEAGLDVNLILYALWLGVSGRGRWDEREIAAAQRAVRCLRTNVIEPLRALRRRLKPVAEADVWRFREKIQTLEIEAERTALVRLAELAGTTVATGLEKRLADAESNLARYLGAAADGAASTLIYARLRRFAETTTDRGC